MYGFYFCSFLTFTLHARVAKWQICLIKGLLQNIAMIDKIIPVYTALIFNVDHLYHYNCSYTLDVHILQTYGSSIEKRIHGAQITAM